MSQFDELSVTEPDQNLLQPNGFTYNETLDPITRWCAIFSSVTDDNPFATISSDPHACDSKRFCDSVSASDRDAGRFVSDFFDRSLDDDSHTFDVPGSGSDPFSEFESANGGEFRSGHAEIESDMQRSHADGLRVAGSDSESDPGVDVNSEDSNLHLNNIFLEDESEGSEWEEVEEGVFNQRGNLSMMIEELEQLSVTSSSEATELRNLEWEILLGLNTSLEREPDAGSDSDSYLAAVQDEYEADPAEYNTVFGRFVENERGRPSAAKKFVENLPFVELTVEELRINAVVCAVCKDAILAEEKVKRLPCSHLYHGDCIVPWLSIRNTCPVCRYELPTGDPE